MFWNILEGSDAYLGLAANAPSSTTSGVSKKLTSRHAWVLPESSRILSNVPEYSRRVGGVLRARRERAEQLHEQRDARGAGELAREGVSVEARDGPLVVVQRFHGDVHDLAVGSKLRDLFHDPNFGTYSLFGLFGAFLQLFLLFLFV